MSARVGIHEVAAAAGVSTTTVSHALNGRGKVSTGTRERVQRVARELGYRPNRIASALRNRRTGVLGFVSDQIATGPFAGDIVRGAQDAAAERGMTVMVVNSNGDPEIERRQIEVLLAQQVDALIYATEYHRVVEDLPAVGTTPVVLVNAVEQSGSHAFVVPDEAEAGRVATEVLLRAGHVRVVHLTLRVTGPAVDDRIAGYSAAMLHAGAVPLVVRVGGEADAAAGREALERALERVPDLTAVFVFNDPMALGVYQAAAARRITVPRDLSVVGIDNLELIAAQLLPPLTTLALPHAAMGRWAVEEAVRLLEDPSSPARSARVEVPVVHRGSVGTR